MFFKSLSCIELIAKLLDEFGRKPNCLLLNSYFFLRYEYNLVKIIFSNILSNCDNKDIGR